jgi:radical SAM protein with 4Fe4S-binding SPASM domain
MKSGPDIHDTLFSKAASTAHKYGRMASFRQREGLANVLFRTAHALDSTHVGAKRELDKRVRGEPGQIRHLNEIIVGTMGQCNASCIHCPTNKDITGHVPRTPMSMALFEKIVRGVVDNKLAITGQMAFGLHGDGLLDPFLIDRAKLMHAMLPDVPLGITTNAAAYNRKRHKALLGYIDSFTIHCESLRPEVYDELMAPLRFKNVSVKIEQMLEDFPGRIRVSVPVSQLNRAELPEIRQWFMERGARTVVFDPMASRCVDDMSVFNRLALGPKRIRCSSELLDYLVVDSDGMVLGCCQDFQRLEPIGNLVQDDLMETLTSIQRKRFGEKLDQGEHDSLVTCSKCYGDLRTPNFPFDYAENA